MAFHARCGKVWGRALWRDAPWHEVQTQLWHRLSCGQAHATGIKAGTPERVAIPAVEWNDLTWARVGDVDLISFQCGRDAVYQDVLIDAGDIYRLWAATRPSADKATSIMAQESRCRAALVLRMRTLKQDFPQGDPGFQPRLRRGG